MSYKLSSLLFKSKNRQITPIKPNSKKPGFTSPKLQIDILSTQGSLTQSTNYSRHPLTNHPQKRNISFFTPSTPNKLIEVAFKPKKLPFPKIRLAESDRTAMLSFYINGLTKSNPYSLLSKKAKIRLKKPTSRFKNQVDTLTTLNHKSRNKVVTLIKPETNEELFDRYNKGAYREVNRFISHIHKKNKTEILNEKDRLFSSDFKITNRERFTKDLRVVDHADFDFQSLYNFKEKAYHKEISFFNNNFYNTQIYLHDADKQRKTMTSIEDEIIKLNQKAKEDIYAKWKKVIVKAADQFKRCHLSLEALYSGKYKMTVPYQEQYSEEFFKAVKYEDTANINRLLMKNIYLVYSYDYFSQTPLHWAAKRNKYTLITSLISKGANYNAQDKNGRTPLHLASFYNCYEAVLVLLYEISSPFILDKEGQTPVQLTRDYNILHAFKRATLLHLIHSMGKRAVFEANYQRGFLWYILNEIKVSKLLGDKRAINE